MLIESFFRKVLFRNFLTIDLNSNELVVANDSLRNKYAKGVLESILYGLFSIPTLLFVDTTVLASVLIPITMVSGTAWFAVSLVNIKKKFEAFGSELTVDLYRSFVTSLVLLILMTVFSLNSSIFGGISEYGKSLPIIVFMSGVVGTCVVIKMIFDVFSGATKYDMNDSMLTGQNEAAEKYFKRSLSLLNSCSDRLKIEGASDVTGYYVGLAFSEVYNYIILVKGHNVKYDECLKISEKLKATPATDRGSLMPICNRLVENFLSFVTFTQDVKIQKSIRNIKNELNALKRNASESQNVSNLRLATILEEMEDLLTGYGEALFKKKLEIERKFLVDKVPDTLTDYQHTSILQGYLPTVGNNEVRIRKEGGICTRTEKEGLSEKTRIEFEEYISSEEFERLWSQTSGKRIEKERYTIPYMGLMIELDIFAAKNAGLKLAEVEFESQESSELFKIPGWFGKEVTKDPTYKNINLAK